jgi:hypothetical protein
VIVVVKGDNGIPDGKEKYEDDYNDDTQRDLELENIAGNLMIAEYQVDKLRQKLGHHIRDIKYHSFNSAKASTHTFEYNGKWYKLSVKAEELSLDSSSISSDND